MAVDTKRSLFWIEWYLGYNTTWSFLTMIATGKKFPWGSYDGADAVRGSADNGIAWLDGAKDATLEVDIFYVLPIQCGDSYNWDALLSYSLEISVKLSSWQIIPPTGVPSTSIVAKRPSPGLNSEKGSKCVFVYSAMINPFGFIKRRRFSWL